MFFRIDKICRIFKFSDCPNQLIIINFITNIELRRKVSTITAATTTMRTRLAARPGTYKLRLWVNMSTVSQYIGDTDIIARYRVRQLRVVVLVKTEAIN